MLNNANDDNLSWPIVFRSQFFILFKHENERSDSVLETGILKYIEINLNNSGKKYLILH